MLSRKPKLKSVPNYIPRNVSEAYQQACVLAEISPKASSALARYCLQSMIWDFWKMPKDTGVNIASGIDSISRILPPETLTAINCVRKFETLGDQLKADANLPLPTTKGEAKVLIGLLELLFEDWYADRQRRKQRMKALQAMAGQTQENEKPLVLTKVHRLPDPKPVSPDPKPLSEDLRREPISSTN